MTLDQFNSVSEDSRLWLFQSPRILSPSEIKTIEEALGTFLLGWKTHGSQMTAVGGVVERVFIAVVADEQQMAASGCSIDSMTRLIQEIGKRLELDFFNRMLVWWVHDGEIVVDKMHDFWAKRKAGVVNGDTLVYDTTVNTMKGLRNHFLVPFDSSWHASMW